MRPTVVKRLWSRHDRMNRRQRFVDLEAGLHRMSEEAVEGLPGVGQEVEHHKSCLLQEGFVLGQLGEQEDPLQSFPCVFHSPLLPRGKRLDC